MFGSSTNEPVRSQQTVLLVQPINISVRVDEFPNGVFSQKHGLVLCQFHEHVWCSIAKKNPKGIFDETEFPKGIILLSTVNEAEIST